MEPDETTSQPAELPPLRIHHFMLWTVVTAVLLTVLKTVSDDELGASYMQGGSILYHIIQALALCCLVLGITWKLKGRRFFHQPGHMAYISQSLNALFMITWATLWKIPEAQSWAVDDRSLLQFVLLYGWYALFLAQAVLSLIYARLFRTPRRWCYFFVFDAFASIFQLIGYLILNFSFIQYASTNLYWWFLIQSSWPLICSTPVVIWLASIACKDYRQRVEYHWTHWLGIGISSAMWVAILISLLISILYPPAWLTEQMNAAIDFSSNETPTLHASA